MNTRRMRKTAVRVAVAIAVSAGLPLVTLGLFNLWLRPSPRLSSASQIKMSPLTTVPTNTHGKLSVGVASPLTAVGGADPPIELSSAPPIFLRTIGRGVGRFISRLAGFPQKFWPTDVAAGDPAYRRYLNAITTHESVDGTQLVGDGGKSLGPLHITYKCWVDGCRELGVAWPWWPYVLFQRFSERVITAYYAKYAPGALLAGDWRVLAQLHNGGPTGSHKPHTLAYWRKIEAIMDNGTHGRLSVGIKGRRWHGGIRAAQRTPDYRFRRTAGSAMWTCEAKEFFWASATPLFVAADYE